VLPVRLRALVVWVSRLLAMSGVLAGGSCATGDGMAARAPQLREARAEELWFTVPGRCGQGPYEVELPALGARWGEGLELAVRAPRRVRVTTELTIDGRVDRQETFTVGPEGISNSEAPENQRCVADPMSLSDAVAASAGGQTLPGSTNAARTAAPGGRAPVPGGEARGRALLPVAPRTGAAPQQGLFVARWKVEGLGPLPLPPGARFRIRIWSVAPNDFDGLFFVVLRFATHADVSDSDYEAYLRAEEARRRERAAADAERERIERERRSADEARRQDEEQRRARSSPPPHPPTAAELARAEQETAERQRQAAERERRAREAELAREREARTEALRRQQFCDAHLDNTGCWGPGGVRVRNDLDRRRDARNTYCRSHPEEARCWSPDDWSAASAAWEARQADAESASAAEPKSPPPPQRDEAVPPRPSDNADWRPGYWYWARVDWLWIAGSWRVPDADIRAGRTTHAPGPPPPSRTEPAQAPAIAVLVWTPGYWQWDGRGWLWIAGSWQVPPTPRAVWRATEWRAHGAVHILVPGGWISAGAP